MTSRARALPSNPAPWAEVVPGAGPMTADDLLAIPDDGYIYEVVEGVLVRMAGSGDLATTAMRLGSRLAVYVEDNGLGYVTGADGVYTFPTAKNGLIPDVGFYRAARRADIPDRTKPIPFAPDLAVEVASPSQDSDDMAAKAQRYLAGGTRLVWVVWPEDRQIDVWHSGDVAPATLGIDDVLDGEDVVPGFTYPIGRLFA